jgi:nucleoside-diphosphate kinase
VTSDDRTLVLCKPDCVERGLVGEVISRIEGKGLKLVTLQLRSLDEATAKRHYAELESKPFFADLVQFVTRSPLVAMVVEGPDAWKVVRTLMGATNPREAAPGTIRGDLAIDLTENLVHGSDGAESATREIAVFFPELAT